MAVRIRITNQIVGCARFYEKSGRQGRWRLVPTYRTLVSNGDIQFECSVTRDTLLHVFRVGDAEECPPTKARKPFLAWIRTDQERFRLQLYEKGAGDEYTLFGDDIKIRKFIQIHHGPATSRGCLMVAGGKKGYRRFRTAILKMVKNDPTILVYIQRR